MSSSTPQPLTAPDFTAAFQSDGRLLIAWPSSIAADYRVYAAQPGQAYDLIAVVTFPNSSFLYDAPVGIAIYFRVYADTPAGPSPTKTVGPITRAAVAPSPAPSSPITPPAPIKSVAPIAPTAPVASPAPIAPIISPAPLAPAPSSPAPTPAPASLTLVCCGAQAPAVAHIDLTNMIGSPTTIADIPLLQTNFGDAQGTFNTLPGFNAAHLYTNPGVYTITATATHQDPLTLAQSTISTTTKITITPDARRYVYVSSAGNDANPGTSIAPVLTFARALALATTTVPKQSPTIASAGILFRRGDVFDLTTGVSVLMTNARFADFGSATLPPPRLRYTGPRATACAIFVPSPGSRDVIFQNIAFDSIYTSDTDYIGNLTAIQPAGTNIAAVNCLFLNISSAVNCQSLPDGMLVQNCQTPQITAAGAQLPTDTPDTTTPGITGLRAYTVYVEGSHVVLLNNIVADSTREHAFRVGGCTQLLVYANDLQNLDRTPIDPSNIAKGCLPIQIGQYAWVASNTFRTGPVGVGPLNRLDLLTDPTYPTLKAQRFIWAVIENNTFLGSSFLFQPGAEHTIARNNLSLSSGVDAWLINGYTTAYDRDVTDAQLLNNTALDTATTGRFLIIAAPNITDPPPPNRALATNIVCANNLHAAPSVTIGQNGAAPVFIQEADLRSFAKMANNVWPSPTSRLQDARDGINYVLAGITMEMSGFLNPAAWAKLGATDAFQTITVLPTGTATSPPPAPNIKGSFTTRAGSPRPTTTTVGAT